MYKCSLCGKSYSNLEDFKACVDSCYTKAQRAEADRAALKAKKDALEAELIDIQTSLDKWNQACRELDEHFAPYRLVKIQSFEDNDWAKIISGLFTV